MRQPSTGSDAVGLCSRSHRRSGILPEMCIRDRVKHGRGGVISFLVPGQQRAARFRASTLGDGYGPEDVQAVIDGKAPTRTATARKAPAPPFD